MTLPDFLATYQSALTVLGIPFLTQGLKRAMGPAAKAPVGERLFALVPAGLGLGIGMVPGWLPGEASERIVGGLLLGASANMLYSFVKRRTTGAPK